MTESQETPNGVESIDLKNPELAALLAWLIPGLGHLYQGRIAKACLFFVCIMGTFTFGVYLGSSNVTTSNKAYIGWGRVVYFSFREGDRRFQYLCQVGAGLPALPALVQSYLMSRGDEVLFDGFMAPPRLGTTQGNVEQPTLHALHFTLARYFELGTVFTMIAGLLNILAVYDAWGGPVLTEASEKEEEEDGSKDEDKGEDDKE